MSTAILIDGGYFLRRFPRVFPQRNAQDAGEVARTAFRLALDHLKDERLPGVRRDLYRIFFYDCPPLMKKAHQPITGKAIDFSRTPVALFRSALHEELKKLRKCALRLGHLAFTLGDQAILLELLV
jgi:hypothetical protein